MQRVRRLQDDTNAAVYHRGLHRFAVVLALCTLGLIAAGGMVTSTDSGLSVPDWPTTYGYNMFTFPPARWVGGIFYEHGHRLIASTVGLLTIVLAVWLKLRERRAWLRRLGAAALFTVIFQGLLGGMTVLYMLPTWISVFHACLAQVFFCLVVSIAVFTSHAWVERAASVRPAGVPRAGARPHAGRWCLAGVIAIFVQLVLGALMRHTDSGLAVPDFPLAYKQVVPVLSHEAVESYNRLRAFEYYLPEVTRSQIVVHLLHRIGAIVVTLVLLTAVVQVLRTGIAALRMPALAAAFLLVVQVSLGAWTVWSGRLPAVATAHVAVGAALLGACWLLTLRCLAISPVRRAYMSVRDDVSALAGAAA